MSKQSKHKHNYSQVAGSTKTANPSQSVAQPAIQKSTQQTEAMTANFGAARQVQPEQMSLDAYKHIQQYLDGKDKLTKDEVTAVLRLSQHLRVFGLLSAVGYLNQSKEGKVQERTAPVWKSLLGQLVDAEHPLGKKELMQKVEEIARKEPSLYMATWRRALMMSNHWNFWARAYQQEG